MKKMISVLCVCGMFCFLTACSSGGSDKDSVTEVTEAVTSETSVETEEEKPTEEYSQEETEENSAGSDLYSDYSQYTGEYDSIMQEADQFFTELNQYEAISFRTPAFWFRFDESKPPRWCSSDMMQYLIINCTDFEPYKEAIEAQNLTNKQMMEDLNESVKEETEKLGASMTEIDKEWSSVCGQDAYIVTYDAIIDGESAKAVYAYFYVGDVMYELNFIGLGSDRSLITYYADSILETIEIL